MSQDNAGVFLSQYCKTSTQLRKKQELMQQLLIKLEIICYNLKAQLKKKEKCWMNEGKNTARHTDQKTQIAVKMMIPHAAVAVLKVLVLKKYCAQKNFNDACNRKFSDVESHLSDDGINYLRMNDMCDLHYNY